jgi:hypothetical protein
VPPWVSIEGLLGLDRDQRRREMLLKQRDFKGAGLAWWGGCGQSPASVLVTGIATVSRLKRYYLHHPSVTTLSSRSSQNQRGNCDRILAPCLCIAFFSLLSSSLSHLPVRPPVSLMLRFKAPCQRFLHCIFVRPGTRADIAPHFLPLCVCTASFSLLSSTAVQLPVRPFARPMLGSRTSFHLLQH